MQHEALTAIEAHPEAPLLPAHRPAVDGKARAFWLADLDRLQVATELAEGGPILRLEHELRVVIARMFRDGNDAVVGDVGHLHLVHVNGNDQSLDGSRVSVLSRR